MFGGAAELHQKGDAVGAAVGAIDGGREEELDILFGRARGGF